VDERLINFPENKDMPKNVWRPEMFTSVGLSVHGGEEYTTIPKFYTKERTDGKVGNLIIPWYTLTKFDKLCY
jgi:hypothetical protein